MNELENIKLCTWSLNALAIVKVFPLNLNENKGIVLQKSKHFPSHPTRVNKFSLNLKHLPADKKAVVKSK